MNLQTSFARRPPSAALCAASSALAPAAVHVVDNRWAVGPREVYFWQGLGFCDCEAASHGVLCRHLLAVAVADGWAHPLPRPFVGDPFEGLA